MKQRRVDVSVYTAVAALLIGSCVFCVVQNSAYKAKKKSHIQSDGVAEHLSHADMYYWFAMRDGGAMSSVKYGEKQLAEARKDLKEMQEDPAAIADFERKIVGVTSDLGNQRKLHHDTFRGVFGWAHYIAEPTLFSGHRATGLYEFVDQPDVIAIRDAVKGLIADIKEQAVVPQYDVLFVSDPHDQQLENETLYLFNQSSRFFVNNYHGVNATLTPEEQEKVRNLKPDAAILKKLRKSFGHNDILFVSATKVDNYDYYHFYNAQARVFKGVDPKPAAVLNNYGFCRERNHMLAPIICFNVLMLLATIVVFRVLAQHSSLDAQPPAWKNTLGLATISFIWGRAAVWGLAELVEEVMPPDETLAILAWWWPVLTGLVMIFGAAFILRFAEKRFGWLSSRYGTFNRGGALFAAITMGSCTYCGQSALYVKMWEGWYWLVPFVLVAVTLAYVIGRALDESDPVKSNWGIIAFALVLMVGPAYCSTNMMFLWLLAIPTVALSKVTLSNSQLITTAAEDEVEAESDSEPGSIKDLQRKAHRPPFQKTVTFEKTWQHLLPWLNDGKTVHLELTGKAGTGKTALINAIVKEGKSADRNLAILDGACPEPQEGQIPESYRPIADAIADHFSVNLLAPSESQMLKIDKAVDGIFEEVVPFSDLLFPESEHGSSGSKTELFHSVASMLRRLATKRRVLMIVDDTHWVDQGSKDLLKYLLKEIPAGTSASIAIITASRSELGLVQADQSLPLAKLTRQEAREILNTGMCLTSAIADQLLDAVSGHDDNLHWLFQMVSHLAAHDVLEWKDGSFTFKDSATKLSDHLPHDIRDSLVKAIQLKPHFRPVLECAACIGPEFTVDVLAPSVGLSRLECIRVLDELEVETGIIKDLHHKDDSFAFRSSFVLEVLRQILNVNAFGASQPSPQRIREYHTQLTGAWYSTLERSSSALFRVASHSFASGLRHAKRALEANLTAAHAASAQFQHDQARRYIGMARESAQHSGAGGEELERELLLIECHEAHVEGTGRVDIAEKCLDWLEHHDAEADIRIYIGTAQACYDAGIDTRDQAHFQACAEISRMIIQRFDQPLDQAEGYHFLGISLPIGEKDGRRDNLTKAMELVEQQGSHIEALRLKAKIANSLAEQLSYGSPDDKASAKGLFLASIELKSRKSIRDIEGLAFAHGGLGRLAYFSNDPDFAEARKHFNEDLKYSERIGSNTGQCKMHSLLGGCDIRQNQDYESAIEHYRQAYDFADERVDQFFAISGILECAGKLSRNELTSRFGPVLVDLTKAVIAELDETQRESSPKSAIPRMCLGGIEAALAACPSNSEWHTWMTNLMSND